MEEKLLQYGVLGLLCAILIIVVRELDKRNLAKYKAIDEIKNSIIEDQKKRLDNMEHRLYEKMVAIVETSNELVLSNSHTLEKVAKSMEEVTKYLSMVWERELNK